MLSSYYAGVVELADLPAGRQARKIEIMFYVYALKSENRNYIYVGLTADTKRRIADHNDRKERTTRSYAPFKTILIEEYDSRIEAREREKFLKSGAGKEYLKSH
jgi:putative endonuclease